MTLTFLKNYWAPAAASVLVLAILLFAAWRAWLDSPRGRLWSASARLRQKSLEDVFMELTSTGEHRMGVIE